MPLRTSKYLRNRPHQSRRDCAQRRETDGCDRSPPKWPLWQLASFVKPLLVVGNLLLPFLSKVRCILWTQLRQYPLCKKSLSALKLQHSVVKGKLTEHKRSDDD